QSHAGAELAARTYPRWIWFRGPALILVVAGLGVYAGLVIPRHSEMMRLEAVAITDQSNDFRVTRILIAKSLELSKGWVGAFAEPNDLRSTVAEVLSRSPIIAGTYTAVSVDDRGDRLIALGGPELRARWLMFLMIQADLGQSA